MKRFFVKTITTILAAMLLVSCSRAYKPTNYKKKSRKRCNECSRWSYQPKIAESDETIVALNDTVTESV